MKIAVCGNLPTAIGIVRQDSANRVRQYHDGAWLHLQLDREGYDLILVESCHGEGLPPMQLTAKVEEQACVVYLLAEPPGNVAQIELGMLLKKLKDRRDRQGIGHKYEKRNWETQNREGESG